MSTYEKRKYVCFLCVSTSKFSPPAEVGARWVTKWVELHRDSGGSLLQPGRKADLALLVAS